MFFLYLKFTVNIVLGFQIKKKSLTFINIYGLISKY